MSIFCELVTRTASGEAATIFEEFELVFTVVLMALSRQTIRDG
jgi:hypothetical protein